MRLLISFLLVLILLTVAAIIDINSGDRSDLLSAQNVERVRENIPQEYVPAPPLTLQESQLVHIDYEEIGCLQKNIYFESRNQSYRGQIATAWVTLNRVNSTYYPSTICEVVYQGIHDSQGNPIRNRCKFSWYCDGKSDLPHDNASERRAWLIAGVLAEVMYRDCLKGLDLDQCPQDPTDGALYYHTKDVEPSWSKVYTVSANIGAHIYYTRN